MTPSFIGRMAMMLAGVRPSISFASLPTASTRPVLWLTAMIDGSHSTMPLPFAYTSVVAVPRPIARSFENRLSTDLGLQAIVAPTCASFLSQSLSRTAGSCKIPRDNTLRTGLILGPCLPKVKSLTLDRNPFQHLCLHTEARTRHRARFNGPSARRPALDFRPPPGPHRSCRGPSLDTWPDRPAPAGRPWCGRGRGTTRCRGLR